MDQPLLDIHQLSVRAGSKDILSRVALTVAPEEIMAVVGGSGSGKTTTGLAVLRLLSPALRVGEGRILFEGRDLLSLPETEMRRLRGGGISMVFQEPLHAFNPVLRIGAQIEEVLQYHTGLNSARRRERIISLLDQVGIPDPRRVADSYPHQLSGGLRQRAMLAQAIAGGPRLIIADEPTSSLDVTIQARVLDLFRRLRRELKLSVLLITHDLGIVGHLADRVAVMNAGRVVECGAVREVLARPQHVYTRQLMEALA